MSIHRIFMHILVISLASSCNTVSFTPSEITPGASAPPTEVPTDTLAMPTTPTISFNATTYSPSILNSPSVVISGVESGDVVKVFSDLNCSTEIVNGIATGATIELVIPTLATGTHNFYANTIRGSLTSNCSPGLTYLLQSCPANYVRVPKNSALDVNADFCVMKYEARNVAGNATSTSTGQGWVSINLGDARTECDALNVLNGVANKYYLINNPEWMTIARNMELVPANWDSGIPGTGALSRGWTRGFFGEGELNTWTAPNSEPTCLYNSGIDICGASGVHKMKRTNLLNNGEEIWDLGGNLTEWVDWLVDPLLKPFTTTDGAPVDYYRDLSALTGNVGSTDLFAPKTWAPAIPGFNTSQNIGQWYLAVTGTGGAISRGGDYKGGTRSGIFGADTGWAPNDLWYALGFRCVYRP